jgi:hypothetical protein
MPDEFKISKLGTAELHYKWRMLACKAAEQKIEVASAVGDSINCSEL